LHDPGYVNSFLDGTVDPRILRRIGFPWSPELVRRTLASVGGTLAAAADALAHGAGGNLAGGTHHAFRTGGAGFCVFNDIAVAIRRLFADGKITRAAVVDLDVHQGDGTAAIFEDDPAVLTLSLHGRANFPFRKQRSKIDIDFADNTGDAEYLTALQAVLPRIFDFMPDIVLCQSGVDALDSDKLGRLSLTGQGLRSRDRLVLEGCKSHGIPVVITLGGGYSEPISLTVEAHANIFRLASQLW
jgi:acetoin utilization deacetylase AcuC-like enzyme